MTRQRGSARGQRNTNRDRQARTDMRPARSHTHARTQAHVISPPLCPSAILVVHFYRHPPPRERANAHGQRKIANNDSYISRTHNHGSLRAQTGTGNPDTRRDVIL